MEHRLKAYSVEFRNRFGYSSSEPVNFLSLLQNLDILALFKPLSENFSGLSIKNGEYMFMLVNSNHSIGRQNFTIGHEIYHLFFDENFTPHKCNTGKFPKKNLTEKYADIFASHLLLPEEGIIRTIPKDELDKNKIHLSTIIKIEQTFGSSRAALLYQLNKLGLITSEISEKFSLNVRYNAKMFGYSTELYEPAGERAILGSYGSLANKLFEEGKISEGHYFELMMAIGVDVNEPVADENN